MKALILFITTLSLCAYSIPHSSKDELTHNLTASADSVENSLSSQDENDEPDLEEQQLAEIKSTLKGLNEI